ncbi:MAG: acyl-CoA dehydrogenase [Deltaproteobacteria bacterium]|nr:acyl-CoA dehydrogenase [Deltaproteobacteria bacterium]
MASMIVDERDQKFVLYEMLGIDNLFSTERYGGFSRDVFDMVLSEAGKLAAEVLFPALAEGDRAGCRLENGRVYVPECFHRCYQLYRDGGWIGMTASPQVGGQGLPLVIDIAAKEWFVHNDPFLSYPYLTEGAAHLIAVYGTELQKRKYMGKMYAGIWCGTMCLTEANAGSDVGNIKTRALRQSDGTFRIKGTKQFITGGDHDLAENIIHPVLARIEGDPPGTGGISIFLVPKYLIGDDGSLGRRNDYIVSSIEEKMGFHGSATCVMNFGDNDDCYAELLGEERQGMKIMFQLMNEARIGVGAQSLGIGSIAYLHALQYAKDRLQGSDLENMKNPEAPRTAIIRHPDVRRMLLWMKAHVEGIRALVYYTAYCADRARSEKDEAARETWQGVIEILTPICKAYCSDTAFRITETAIQVHGGYGYCSEYPVEQFMRDIKIASIWEGTNGIQALDLVGRKLGLKKGMYFMNLLGEMTRTMTTYKESPEIKDLTADIQQAVNTLAETAMYFATCARSGKYLIPVGNAYPFLMMMGKVVMGWLLLWEAGVAQKKLLELSAMTEANSADRAFYIGKISAARFFIKHVLPEVEGAVKAIKSEDLSMIEIPEESFTS